ncbi:MAG: helix-turn-helix domain-containing protein [Ilumatobacteraceae bacterium]|jgi:transcriptional regulator with XRE-family HTH domain
MVVDKRLADVGNFIRQQRELAQQSIRDLAKVAGVSNPYLSQIERGLRKPSAEILQQLARAMQISAETLYERAGILDPSEVPRSGVVDAVSSDPYLTTEQKQTLLSVYRSFVGENADSPSS